MVAVSSYERCGGLRPASPGQARPGSTGADRLRSPAGCGAAELQSWGTQVVPAASRRPSRAHPSLPVPKTSQLACRWVLVLLAAGMTISFLLLGVARAVSALSGPANLRGCAMSQPEAGAPGCSQIYVARPGDTIWAVAVMFGKGSDPRPLADQLEAEIGGGVLQPGQHLSVP